MWLQNPVSKIMPGCPADTVSWSDLAGRAPPGQRRKCGPCIGCEPAICLPRRPSQPSQAITSGIPRHSGLQCANLRCEPRAAQFAPVAPRKPGNSAALSGSDAHLSATGATVRFALL
jgi:hypothetical protein